MNSACLCGFVNEWRSFVYHAYLSKPCKTTIRPSKSTSKDTLGLRENSHTLIQSVIPVMAECYGERN